MARKVILSRTRICPTRRSRAYTLLELVIVLSVIGLLAGLSWPMLMRPWSKSRVQQAAQDLSRELLRTRLQAIERGQAFQLRWRPGTGEFAIRPWQPPAREVILLGDESSLDGRSSSQLPSSSPTGLTTSNVESTAGTATDPLTGNTPDEPSAVNLLQLTDGVVFLDPLQPTEAPSEDETILPGAAPRREDRSSADRRPTSDPLRDELSSTLESATAWSSPIWFYPDGRTTNGRWTLVGEDGYQIDVTLRGWVGSVRVGPVQERVVPDAELVDGGPEAPIGDPGRTTLKP